MIDDEMDFFVCIEKKTTDECGVQIDDGSRNALRWVRDKKTRGKLVKGLLDLCREKEEYGKARVFLELLWEYESRLPKVVKDK